MFGKVLIACRGESAVRISRTCERMGIATVAVHDDADIESPHVRACDEASLLEGGGSSNPYLDTGAILQAAQDSQSEAIHPGYGELGTNPDFAHAVRENGLRFMGPDPDTIRTLGNHLQTRSVAAAAGIRLLNGIDEAVTDPETARQRAESIGYPVSVRTVSRATSGEIRIVDREERLEGTFAEAMSATDGGDPQGVCLEHYPVKPRHLEVQLVVDTNGDAIVLGEFECSLQKDGRRLIGETPAPALSGASGGDLKREILWDAALRVAKECGYRNAGTAEFLIDPEGRLYFRDFRPTLSVDHAAIELCSGFDLVGLQIRIAAGKRLPDEMRRVQPSGHAFEAHLYAERVDGESPEAENTITELRWPSIVTGKLRIETGLSIGTRFDDASDPFLAKVATYGTTRHRALLTLDRVLAETAITPVTTNQVVLRRILGDEAFQTGQYDSTFTDTRFGD